ncbi:MAG TPA: ABC transporter permease [Gemmatimonadaceae bacterium]|nr:ABC transporter permease [Gemmatimonadaceae bacterium]
MTPDDSRSAPPHPPALLRRIVRACLPYEDREPLLGELDALHEQRARAHGAAPAAAWYARQAVGFVARVGVVRLVESAAGLRSLSSDARVALRSFRQRPVFAVTFAITLAVGTGVLATVYAAARWVLLRPVPGVTAPDRLATIRLGFDLAPPHVSFTISHPDLLDLRERLPLNGALAASTPIEVDLRPDGALPWRAVGAMVTSNYFSVLGTRMAAGRPFLPEEETAAVGEPVVILSHALARRVVPGGAVVGSRIRVNGAAVRVVGVTPPGFRGATLPGRDELWLPAAALGIIDPSADPRASALRGEGIWRLVIGRLPPSVAAEAVSSAAGATVAAVRAGHRVHSFMARDHRLQVFPGVGLDPSVRASVRRTLAQLGVVAAILLCLAIANLANLAIIESARRGTTTAVRVALGATRARIARGVFVEAALIAAAGSALALWLAWLWTRWFQGTQLSEHGGELGGMHVDGRVALLTVAAGFTAAAIASLRPAMSVRLHSLDRLLRRRTAEDRPAQNVRSVLVAVQIALSLVLLIAAGLLGRTVGNLRGIDVGFRPDGLLTFSLDPHLHGHESGELDRLVRGLEMRFGEESGIERAGFISPSPLRSSYVTASLYGSDDPEAPPLIGAGFYVTPGFLAALGARTIAGERDWRGDSGTVVLTRGTLAKLLPGVTPQGAVGREVPTRRNRQGLVRIAAIIEDVQLSDITREPPPTIFRPLAERFPGLSLTGFVAASHLSTAATTVRNVVTRHAPELPLFDVRTARAAVDLQFADRHAMARVASTLGIIGLLLALVGLYGVLAAMVAARRRETGIRSALGATPADLLVRTLRYGLGPLAAGVPVGLAGAVLLSRLLAPQLFGLEALDGAAYGAAIGVLVVCTVTTALVPAWRVARRSPAEVLRDE